MLTLHAPHMDRTCSSNNVRACLWERLDCEWTGEWRNRDICVLIWVCIPAFVLFDLCVFMSWASSLCLCASGSCCLPSLPAGVCPVGSSRPARWEASRVGSPGPQGVLFPAPASPSLQDSPPATCVEIQSVVVPQKKMGNEKKYCLNPLNRYHSRGWMSNTHPLTHS